MLDEVRKLIGLSLVTFFLLVVAVPAVAQEKDSLVACIEEVKKIREKDGDDWYTKNKTSCLGDGVIGKWSVLKLDEFSKKEIVNDMELEFFAFFDVPVTGVEAREGQMEYRKTSESKDPGSGYRMGKKLEEPGIGDKSQHLIETTYVNITASYDLPTTWVEYVAHQELMVVIDGCSFMVGGRMAHEPSWSFNHRVDWAREVIINSDHDHGEEKMKQAMQEYAKSVVGRVTGVCGGFGDGRKATGTKKSGVTDWTKGLLGKRETVTEKTEEKSSFALGAGIWEKVEFRQWTEGASNKVNDWITENLGTSEMKIETMEKELPPPPMVERITESRLIPGAVIKNYRDGVMVELTNGGWIYIPPKGEIIYASDQWKEYFDILSGEAEIETNGNRIEVRTANATVKTRGTRYWVAFDSNKRTSTVGVYEGEIEVTARDGKKMTLTTDGGKPRTATVSEKLSPMKLGIVGLVAAGGVGTMLLVILRKRR